MIQSPSEGSLMPPHCFEQIPYNVPWRTPALQGAYLKKDGPGSKKFEECHGPFWELYNAHIQSKSSKKI